jgi:hypothetical protein
MHPVFQMYGCSKVSHSKRIDWAAWVTGRSYFSVFIFSTFLPLQTREVLDAMREDVDWDAGTVLRVDGGASQNDLLMQIQVRVGPL